MSNLEQLPLGEARRVWTDALRRGEAACPCCRQVPRLREYQFTSTMALAMIHLYHRRESAPVNTIPERLQTGESLIKLVLWGYAVPDGLRYRLSENGRMAVLLQKPIAMLCTASRGVPLWFSGDVRMLGELLGTGFDYATLMSTPEAK